MYKGTINTRLPPLSAVIGRQVCSAHSARSRIVEAPVGADAVVVRVCCYGGGEGSEECDD